MIQRIGNDLYGRPCLLAPQAAVLENGIRMETGNTYLMNRAVYEAFLNMLHNLVKWNYQPRRFPHTIWRSIILVVIFYLRCLAEGKLSEVWNEFYHVTSIPDQGWSVCTNETNENFMKHYNLQIGDKYWVSQTQLMLVVCGDGYSKIPKSPNDINSGSAGLVKIHAINHDNLHQSLYSGLPFLISGLSHYNPKIAELYHLCSREMGVRGGLSFRCNSNNVKICVDWYRYDNGDWPWLSTVVHRCYSHSGDFPFIYWIRHIGKEWVSVQNDIQHIYDAICAGIKDEHMPWNLNVNNIRDDDDFYCLTTDYHWRHWCNNIFNFIQNLPNKSRLSHKKLHKKRRDFAHDEAQCALYSIPIPLVQYVLDVMHAILRHAVNTIKSLTILISCVFKFNLERCTVVLSHICM